MNDDTVITPESNLEERITDTVGEEFEEEFKEDGGDISGKSVDDDTLTDGQAFLVARGLVNTIYNLAIPGKYDELIEHARTVEADEDSKEGAPILFHHKLSYKDNNVNLYLDRILIQQGYASCNPKITKHILKIIEKKSNYACNIEDIGVESTKRIYKFRIKGTDKDDVILETRQSEGTEYGIMLSKRIPAALRVIRRAPRYYTSLSHIPRKTQDPNQQILFGDRMD